MVIPLSAPAGPPYPLTESVTPSAPARALPRPGWHPTTFPTLVRSRGGDLVSTDPSSAPLLGSPKPTPILPSRFDSPEEECAGARTAPRRPRWRPACLRDSQPGSTS
jgi:hypothetical protein